MVQFPRIEDRLLEMISAVPLFSGLRRKKIEKIADAGKRLSYDPERKIVKKGEKGVGFYLILEGEAEVRVGNKVVARINRGNFFGEMALLDSQPRSADIVATTPITCFGLMSSSFEELLQKEPEIILAIIKELVHRIRSTNAALTD